MTAKMTHRGTRLVVCRCPAEGGNWRHATLCRTREAGQRIMAKDVASPLLTRVIIR